MLSRRQMLLRASALAGAAAGASVSFAAAADGLAGDATAGADVVAWLKGNALPLAATAPGSSFHDLEPLRARFAEARIVSLGESTHGTREFFQLKHRVIEYCVSQLGFAVIAFEANYGTTLPVNDYVLEGKGTASDVVAGMGFPIWDAEEVLALIEWVRGWNLTHDRKVKFHGLDMQYSSGAALHVLAYLERVAPALATASERTLAPLVSDFTLGRFSNLPEAAQQEIMAHIKMVLDSFAAGRAQWIARSSEMQWHLARQSAVLLDRYTRSARIPASELREGFTIRDQAMADTVAALLEAEGPGAKALLWAHNGHVKRERGYDFATGTLDAPTMGSFLHAAFGRKYVAVGFAFNRGSFRSKSIPAGESLATFTVGPAPEGMLDAVLALTGIPLFALDLAPVPPDGPVARWMASRPFQRLLPGQYAPDREHLFDFKGDPRDNFDVLIFVETTTAARSIRRPAPGNMVAAANDEPRNLALAGAGPVPEGWRAIEADYFPAALFPYAVALADEPSPGGGRAMRITRGQSPLWWGDGAAGQSFPAAPWRGRRFTFSAAMRAEAPRIGTGAQLVVVVWRKDKDPILAVQSGGTVRSQRWTRQSVAVDVPENAERIEIKLVVTCNAAGWFGDLQLDGLRPAHTN